METISQIYEVKQMLLLNSSVFKKLLLETEIKWMLGKNSASYTEHQRAVSGLRA